MLTKALALGVSGSRDRTSRGGEVGASTLSRGGEVRWRSAGYLEEVGASRLSRGFGVRWGPSCYSFFHIHIPFQTCDSFSLRKA